MPATRRRATGALAYPSGKPPHRVTWSAIVRYLDKGGKGPRRSRPGIDYRVDVQATTRRRANAAVLARAAHALELVGSQRLEILDLTQSTAVHAKNRQPLWAGARPLPDIIDQASQIPLTGPVVLHPDTRLRRVPMSISLPIAVVEELHQLEHDTGRHVSRIIEHAIRHMFPDIDSLVDELQNQSNRPPQS